MHPKYPMGQRLMASILLISLFLQSCYNPAIPTKPVNIASELTPLSIDPPEQILEGSLEDLAGVDQPISNEIVPTTVAEVGIPSVLFDQGDIQIEELALQPAEHVQSSTKSITTQPFSVKKAHNLPSRTAKQTHHSKEKSQDCDFSAKGISQQKALQARQDLDRQARSKAIDHPLVSQVFQTKPGQAVRFYKEQEVWKARVEEKVGHLSRSLILPVYAEDLSLPTSLKPSQIHVIEADQAANKRGYVYVGRLGLPGGMIRDEEEGDNNAVVQAPIQQGDFSNLVKIGEGSFGIVYKGIWKRSLAQSISVAIKTLKDLDNLERSTEKLAKETHIIENIIHKNIVRFFGIHDIKIGNNMVRAIITELMAEGSAEDFLRKHTKRSIKPMDILSIALDAATGMRYLHENDIIHRDLAARNLLLTFNNGKPMAKVSDFGLSRKLPSEQEIGRAYYQVNSDNNPIRWSAPEAFLKKQVSTRSDLWSFGVVLYELFTLCKTLPYEDFSNGGIVKKIKLKEEMYKYLTIPDCPDGIQELVNSCMNNDSHARPVFDKIISKLKKTQEKVKVNNAWNIEDDNNAEEPVDLGDGTYVPTADSPANSTKEEKEKVKGRSSKTSNEEDKKLEEEPLSPEVQRIGKLMQGAAGNQAELDQVIKTITPNGQAIVQALANNRNEFTPGGYAFTETDMAVLVNHPRFKQLTEIRLDGKLNAASLKILAPHLKGLTKLQYLHLGNNQIRAVGLQALVSNLQGLTNLQYLVLENNQIGDVGLQALAPNLKGLTNLRDLYLQNNQIGDVGLQALAPNLKGLTNLRYLNLSTNQIGAVGLQALVSNLQGLTNLQYLVLENNQIGDVGLQALAPNLEGLTNLQYLILENNQIGDVGLQALAPNLKGLTKLVYLHLGTNQIGDVSLQALAPNLQGLTNLQDLILNNNQIGAVGLQDLAPHLKELTNLQNLNLKNNQIGDRGIQALAPNLQGLTKLQYLHLGNNQIGAVGIQALAPNLQGLTKLYTLTLENNQIGAAGLQVLVPHLKGLTELKKLHLEGNQIGAVGIQALAPHLKELTNLLFLHLEGNQIGDVGLQALAPHLKELTNSLFLYLSNNQIGEVGVKALGEHLQAVSSGKQINLRGNPISKGTQAWLQQQCPGTGWSF
jgi:serine/threonine protein kinase/Ran GTPase-activating protein (RanGAP) involved in mRNA processing and transport